MFMYILNLTFFSALLELPAAQFKLFIDSAVWGFKHTMRDIADIGLQLCYELIENFSKTDPAIAGAFYQSYYLSLLQDIFFVLTDRDHKSGKFFTDIITMDIIISLLFTNVGFKGQTEVLALLFNLVTTYRITVPLDASQVQDPSISNAQFLEQYITTLLQNAFPHLQRYTLMTFNVWKQPEKLTANVWF